MNIVEQKANKFINDISYLEDLDVFLRELDKCLYMYLKTSDKILFLTTIATYVKKNIEEHESECENSSCHHNDFNYEMLFFINQKLEGFGIGINTDEVFSENEKNEYNRKLDAILARLETLGNGLEVIFNEIEILKNLYFLGKKNWSEIFTGKLVEMALAGIISETVSKEIINTFKGSISLLQ